MLFTVAMVAQAAVLDVGVGQAYPTVGAAVAASVDGDVVVVHDALVAEDVVVDGLELTIRSASRSTWQHVPPPNGGAPDISNLELRNGASVRLVGFDFVGDRTYRAIQAVGSELTVRSSTFERFAVAVETYGESSVDVQDSVFRRIAYSALLVSGGSLEVSGSTFLRNGDLDSEAGAIHADGGSTLDVRRTVFAGNRGDRSGAVNSLDATITDSVFLNNSSESRTSAIHSWGRLVLERNRFCGNESTFGSVSFTSGSDSVLRNNAFLDNADDLTGSALMVSGDDQYRGPVELEHNTFLGNAGPWYVAVLGYASVTMVGNLVTGNTTGDVAFVTDGTSTMNPSYNAWSDNTGGDADFALGATDLVGVDPMLSGAGAACSWDRIRPAAGSPLIDGNPTLLDRDGTAADIGATGGPSAP